MEENSLLFFLIAISAQYSEFHLQQGDNNSE